MTERSLRAEIEEIEGHPRNHFYLGSYLLRMRTNGCMTALPTMATLLGVLLVLFLPDEQLDEGPFLGCEVPE